MSQPRTRVRPATVRNRAPLAHVQDTRRRHGQPSGPPGAPEKPERIGALSFGERMLRNTAVCVAALLCVLAAQSLNTPGTQGAQSLLSQIVTMDLSESLGSLRFVSDLMPQTVRVFWNLGAERYAAPSDAAVVHVFSAQEPWIAYGAGEVRAGAAGEVMSVSADARGRSVVRLRHASGMETLYGNLLRTDVREGNWVEAGDVLGAAKEMTYELRGEGRPMDPAPYWQ